MALSLLSALGPGPGMLPREEVEAAVQCGVLGRRKQKHPRPISSSSEGGEAEQWEGGALSPGRDISDMVKVEIHPGPEEVEERRTPGSPRSTQPLFPPMEDLMRKCNLIPFGEVTIQNHPNTPPIPMTVPMTYLFPISKDAVTGEAKYKMLVPRNGGEMALGFPPMIPFPSPPLLPHMVPPPGFRPEEVAAMEQIKKLKSAQKPQQKPAEMKERPGPLKVEVKETIDSSSSPLDLTHRSPSSSHSGEDEAKSPRKDGPAASRSPEQKLGPEIEAQLNFLKVKQMEFLKQAAESAAVNRCNECNINFSKYQNYVAHKKYYCSGLKQGQAQDSDEDTTPSSVKPKTSPVQPAASPPFPATPSQAAAANKAVFARDFFLGQKALLEVPGGPKLPPGLLLAPGALPPPPSSSHFVCQGCGIKFKSISNLQAHQSRYCAGIKTAEEGQPQPGPGLEALLKAGLGQLPMQGMSAADMMSFLSAQQALKAEAGLRPEGPQEEGRERRTPPQGRGEAGAETGDDFCCILCGYKESSVDKLKDHINMHFIGQVKKRKSENEGIAVDDLAEKEKEPEPAVKKIKVESKERFEERVSPGGRGVSPAPGDAEPSGELTCANCDISFVNPATYSAHVQYYCKKKAGAV